MLGKGPLAAADLQGLAITVHCRARAAEPPRAHRAGPLWYYNSKMQSPPFSRCRRHVVA